MTSKLKLTKDGRFVLWPQPSDDPEDPQNVRFKLSSFLRYFKLTKTTQWSDRSKSFQLFIIVLAAIVPDFDSGIGLKYLLSHSECEISCMLYRDCICFRFGQAVPDFVS